jgi:peptide-methionine (S)-S-oxide reductase
MGNVSLIFAFSAMLFSCSSGKNASPTVNSMSNEDSVKVVTLKQDSTTMNLDTATFGAGCFWCIEAVFQEVKGVVSVTSGYTGGTTKNPTYEEICTGRTGHAEVARIVYDTTLVSFDALLEIFWQTHDPTTLNQQGNDVGTQYRSAVFYHNDEQRRKAEQYKKELDASGAWDKPLVTEITALGEFYPAENYHQNYYRNNPNQGYCRYVIQPKMEKFRKVFKDKLK